MKQRMQKACKVTIEGLALNIGLTMLKMATGFLSHSSALIADAFHSLSDMSTDLALLWGVKAAARPEDDDHQYGHGRIETMISAGIGIFLFAVGGTIFFDGVYKVYTVLRGDVLVGPGWFACVAALISAVSKEWMYRRTVLIGNQIESRALVANAWHHRSDALSSFGVMIGIFGAIILGKNWYVLDPIVAVVVSVFVIKAAYSIVGESFDELMEGALTPEEEKEIYDLVNTVSGANQAHKLRTRRVGHRVAIELHIRVQQDLNVQQGHDIATNVENVLRDRFGKGTFISVHIEPLGN